MSFNARNAVTLFGVTLLAPPAMVLAAPDVPDAPTSTVTAPVPETSTPSDDDIKKTALADKINIPELAVKLRQLAVENYSYAAKNNGARLPKWAELVALENVVKTPRLLQDSEIAKKYPALSADPATPPSQLNAAGDRTDLWNVGLTIFIFKNEKSKPAAIPRSQFYTTAKMLEDQIILMYRKDHKDYLLETARILDTNALAPKAAPAP